MFSGSSREKGIFPSAAGHSHHGLVQKSWRTFGFQGCFFVVFKVDSGFQGCFFVVFKVFSSWFPCDLLWFGVGFSLWIPPFTLSSCPLEWPFTLHCLMEESDTLLVFLNSKWLIKGGLMPEVIHGVGLPHGELGLVSTLMWAFQGSASLVFVLQYPRFNTTGFNTTQFPYNAQKPHHNKGGLHKTNSTLWYPQIWEEMWNCSGMRRKKCPFLQKF